MKSENLNRKSNIEVEWYSGKELYTHPKRIKVDGVWEEVFRYDKRIRENTVTKKREIVFRCHIGDNRIVEVVFDD